MLLNRLTTHIMPFRTAEGDRFLKDYYYYLDRRAKETQCPHAYRFDESVGEANFIDKLLAREEAHHLQDYKLCAGGRRRHPALWWRLIEIAFRENDRDLPFGCQINNPQWDNNYANSHQEPLWCMATCPTSGAKASMASTWSTSPPIILCTALRSETRISTSSSTPTGRISTS